MKLDTRAMRHLAAEDWRVLTAVRKRIPALDLGASGESRPSDTIKHRLRWEAKTTSSYRLR